METIQENNCHLESISRIKSPGREGRHALEIPRSKRASKIYFSWQEGIF